MNVSRRFIALLTAAVLSLPSSAWAQSSPHKAQAEALFSSGRELLEAGKFAEACDAFERSEALDSAPGTLLNLAVCHERLGRTASAWLAYRRAAARARATGQTERVEAARRQADRLEPELSYVTLKVAGQELSGLVVELDGKILDRAGWGAPLPVDPGGHRLVARAPDHQPFETQFTVTAPASAATVTIPELKPLAQEVSAPPAAGSAPAPAKVTPAPSLPEPAERRSGTSTQRVVGYVVGGAGVVTLGVAGVFGVRMLNKRAQSDEHCNAANVCSDTGAELRRDAQAAGDVATVVGLIGLAAVGTGVTLVLTSSESRSVAARFSTTGFTLDATF